MIVFNPLWETMKRQKATTYTLMSKNEENRIGSTTLKRLRQNESVSTNTLEKLCRILECDLSDIIEFIPDPK